MLPGGEGRGEGGRHFHGFRRRESLPPKTAGNETSSCSLVSLGDLIGCWSGLNVEKTRWAIPVSIEIDGIASVMVFLPGEKGGKRVFEALLPGENGRIRDFLPVSQRDEGVNGKLCLFSSGRKASFEFLWPFAPGGKTLFGVFRASAAQRRNWCGCSLALAPRCAVSGGTCSEAAKGHACLGRSFFASRGKKPQGG